MSQFAGIEADFATWRPVQGRKVLQLVFEVPIENTQLVLDTLGIPQTGQSKWCAIALLNQKAPEPEGQVSEANGSSKKQWSEYSRSQQAAILCSDEDFQRYIGNPLNAADWLRAHFRISSRKELDEEKNHGNWDEFVAIYNLRKARHG